MVLQDLILSRLSRKDLLEAFSHEFMESHLGPKGFIIGVFVQNELIAFRNVYFPEIYDREWNLGYDIGLESPGDLEQVANLQMICVHPNFRGKALGQHMNVNAIEIIRRLQRYTHLCATVSPYNYWNIRVLLKSGFAIRNLKSKYNGKLRYIVYQNLTRPLDLSEIEHRIPVRLTDIECQHDLIRRGFMGVQLREIAGFRAQQRSDYIDGFEIIFSAPPPS
jgi:ribosomal protein S18 acetylase RimI-like enzyme